VQWFRDITIVSIFLVIAILKMATWVAETCRRLLCNKITYIKPGSFVGPFKKCYVLSKFSLHFGNVSFLDTKTFWVFLLQGLLRAPTECTAAGGTPHARLQISPGTGRRCFLRETPGSMQQQTRFQRVAGAGDSTQRRLFINQIRGVQFVSIATT